MATLTVYADAADSTIEASHATYATARAGASIGQPYASTTLGLSDALAGGVYYLDETFLSFDTSSIPDDATITSAVLSLYGKGKTGSPTYTIEACAYDWGASVDNGDWRDGTGLAALTPVATFASSGWNASGYNDFSDTGAGLASVINKTGSTRLIVLSGDLRAGNAPLGNVGVQAASADTADTTSDPKLVITYTEAPPAPVAAFSADVTSGEAPLTVTFTDESTNTPTSWAWVFGDEGTSDQQNPEHEYTAAGTYTVSLVAANLGGSDDEVKVDYIEVTAPEAPAGGAFPVTSGGAFPVTSGGAFPASGGKFPL